MNITVIIPSIRNELTLVEDLKKQTGVNYKLEIIKNVRPNGKARNIGIKKHIEETDIFIFLDDDVSIPEPTYLNKMIEGLKKYEDAGACGIVRVMPKEGINWLQKRIGLEVPLNNLVPPDIWKLYELPLKGKHWLPISTTCIAIKKEVFENAGLFREDIVKGVDTEFFYRMALNNYKFTVVPNLTIPHYPPESFINFIKTHFYYGYGHAYESKIHPDRKIGYTRNKFLLILFLILRIIFFPLHIFIPYSNYEKKIYLSFKPFCALASIFSFFGYFYFIFINSRSCD